MKVGYHKTAQIEQREETMQRVHTCKGKVNNEEGVDVLVVAVAIAEDCICLCACRGRKHTPDREKATVTLFSTSLALREHNICTQSERDKDASAFWLVIQSLVFGALWNISCFPATSCG
ncbi:hypothetical protein KP509_1Z062600 [Ceratopteris richardii]|nr:hypothetical protein KP509_1Z062600 [Ceratopteris richardii]